MAPASRGGGVGGGRERHTTRTSVSNKPTSSPTTDKRPTSSTKPDPNYLKPTFSSSSATATRTTPRRATATKSSLDKRRASDVGATQSSGATTSASSSTPSKASTKPTRGPKRPFSTLSCSSSKPAGSARATRSRLSTRAPPVSALKSEAKTVDVEMACPEERLGDPVMTVEDPLVENDGKTDALDATIEDEHNQESHVEEKHVVVEVEEEKPDAEREVKKERPARRDTRTKKEGRDYNGVIEETANRLMQNKRNKVRALAGAFETVISLQDPK